MMNSNTTALAIFAIIAALGLTTAAFIVIPNIPTVKAFDVNKYKNCFSQDISGHHVPDKCF